MRGRNFPPTPGRLDRVTTLIDRPVTEEAPGRHQKPVTWGIRILLSLAVTYGCLYLLWPALRPVTIDTRVYRAAGGWLLHGKPLYEVGLYGTQDLPFNYPPFAALLFSPLAILPGSFALMLFTVVNLAIVPLVVWRLLRAMGRRADHTLIAITAVASVALFCTEAVFNSVVIGQINLVLLALVVFDLVRTTPSRWQGVGIGVAAAIKLTPLLFIAYLVFTRRFRAAAVATGTFAGTILIGFLIAPGSAVSFWFGGVIGDPARITAAGLASGGNMSVMGWLLRCGLTEGTARLVWMAGGAALGIAVLWVAAQAHRRGWTAMAIGLLGSCCCALSPFSWDHHWVWLLLIAVQLMHAGLRRRVTPWLLLVPFLLLSMRIEWSQWWNDNGLLALFVLALIGTAAAVLVRPAGSGAELTDGLGDLGDGGGQRRDRLHQVTQ
ncbi:DUF2029 domain-containing protein [Pseudonocardiaceae bacterium YIM PH 21723]|nr:DUF2029 domain-containing protein [Pseudonocardiaceae bacterium YIM PH 21723]